MKCFSEIQFFLIVALATLGICSIFVLILMQRFSNGRYSIFSIVRKNSDNGNNSLNIRPKRLLFVVKDISHLVKYFGPSFLNAVKNFDDVFILSIQPCKGRIYRNHKKCSELLLEYIGLDSANLHFVWEERLSTQNDIPWDIRILLKIILYHIRQWDISDVFTYDQEGINEDVGCLAINDAILCMSQKNYLPLGCRVFVLQSVSTIRCFMGIFDLLLSFLLGTPRLVICTTSNFIILLKFYFTFFNEFHNKLKILFILITNRYFLFNNFVPIEDEIDCDIL